MSYLTVRDVADHFKVSTRHVERLIRARELPAAKIGKLWRIKDEWLPAALPDRKPRARKHPDLPLCGVYLLFRETELIYVGRSTELPRRITNHRRAGREFDDVQAIPCDPERANWLEAELIRTLCPTENVKRFERRSRKVAAGLGALVQ